MDNAALREQIEERYLSGDFEGASDLCYQQLKRISEPLDSSKLNPSFSQFRPLLKHQCFDSCCSCEHFLSLSAQFMFELSYPPQYIHSFLTNFYEDQPQLPLVCVGLLASMSIHQMKYEEAQEMLEKAILHSNEDTSIQWTPQDIEKYHHILSILVLGVLIPQGRINRAREYLEDYHHPQSTLPLDKTFLEDAKLAIAQRERELSPRILHETEGTEPPTNSTTGNANASVSVAAHSARGVTSPVVNASRTSPNRTGTTEMAGTGESQITRLKRLVVGQLKRSGKLCLPLTAFVLLMSVIVTIFRKQKRVLPAWAVKLLSGWDLFESAVFPNSALRRMQRQQRNASLL